MTVARQIAGPVVCSDERQDAGVARRCRSYKGFEIAKVIRVGEAAVVGYMLRHPTDRTVLYLLPWNAPETGN